MPWLLFAELGVGCWMLDVGSTIKMVIHERKRADLILARATIAMIKSWTPSLMSLFVLPCSPFP